MPFKSEPAPLPAILMSDVSIIEERTGKRSVVGVFDQFAFPQFPAAYGRFFVTAWLTNLVGAVSELDTACRIQEKASGHVIFSNSVHVAFGQEHTFEKDAVIAFGMAVQGVVFQKPGLYTLVLLLDADEVAKRDFNVILATPPQLPPHQQ
jgi:hypothetical protein